MLVIETALGEEIYATFNQTEKYICFGNSKGFYIYNVDPFKKILSHNIEGGVSIVKMLYESNIILFVGRNTRSTYPDNKLIIWDDDKKRVLGEISFNYKILGVEVNQKYIAVVTEHKIFIYAFETLLLLKSIETFSNPRGIVALSMKNDFVVFPNNNLGTISIYHIISNQLLQIKAHSNHIDYIYINKDCKYIVTCSEKGTIVRIFDTDNGNLIDEFRRGMEAARISDVVMKDDNSLLLVSSDRGTIHLFQTQLSGPKDRTNLPMANNGYSIGLFRNIIPSYFTLKKSVVQFQMNGIITNSVFEKNSNKIYSLGSNGQFYVLNYEDVNKPIIDKTIKFVRDDIDPFSERTSMIQ
jgi:WD40 repeat protein